MCKIRNNTIKSIPIFLKNHILIILIFNFTLIIICWFLSIPIHWQWWSRVYNDLYKCKEKHESFEYLACLSLYLHPCPLVLPFLVTLTYFCPYVGPPRAPGIVWSCRGPIPSWVACVVSSSPPRPFSEPLCGPHAPLSLSPPSPSVCPV